MGALHFLRADIPIYCSPMTAGISKAMQDTGASSALDDYCYCAPKQDDPDIGLSTIDYRKASALARSYRMTDAPSDDLTAFWSRPPASREIDLAEELRTDAHCAGMRIASFPVDHSVYGATAWAVETGAGWVVYSGDLRMHGSYGDYTREFAAQAAKLDPIALILEGTRIEKDESPTEQSVRDACLDVVKRCKGLVVADFGPRNVERLISFAEIARATGRRLAILPKDAYLLEAMRGVESAQNVPSIEDGPVRIYREHSGAKDKWRARLLERHAPLIVTPSDVSAAQDEFICCFSFWDVNEIAYIRPVPGSVWIYSSCEAFNEEMKFSGERLQHWIDKFGMRRVGRLLDDDSNDDPFHVSGHASKPDLMDIVRTIRPKVLIPVHTTKPEVYAQEVGDICEVRMPAKGVPIEL